MRVMAAQMMSSVGSLRIFAEYYEESLRGYDIEFEGRSHSESIAFVSNSRSIVFIFRLQKNETSRGYPQGLPRWNQFQTLRTSEELWRKLSLVGQAWRR